MGTHPIFESDFDCLTEIWDAIDRVCFDELDPNGQNDAEAPHAGVKL